MIIKNLGPIVDLEITLDNLNVFIGPNGSGKTITAYALYSFYNWFSKEYRPQVLTLNDIKGLIIDDKTISWDIENYKKIISEDAVTQFNQLDPNYFLNYFRDTSVYDPKISSIKINAKDVMSIFNQQYLGKWFYVFYYEAQDSVHNGNSLAKVSNKIISGFNEEHNRIYTQCEIYGDKQQKFEIFKSREKQNLAVANDSLKNVFYNSSTVYLPAERIGINVFRKSIVKDKLTRSDDNQLGKDGLSYSYPYPIENYISFINSHVDEQLNDSKYNLKDSRLIEDLVPGKFQYDSNNDTIYYQMHNKDEKVTFDLLSSSLKSLYGLDVVIRSPFRNGWLFIDEPEMNLHPQNQKVIIKLLYILSKHGYHIVASTHSDYLVKELANLLLEDKLDHPDDIITTQVYQFDNNTAKSMGNLASTDFDFSNFDQTTEQINLEYYDLLEKLNKDSEESDE